jgi:hypothetical protein
MHTMWSGHFETVTKLNEQYRYLKELGMDFLGVPKNLYDQLRVAPGALTLYAVLPAGKQRIMSANIHELQMFVGNNPATYQLSFTV